MKKRIEAYLAEGKKIIPEFRAYVTDKSIPLDTRWDTFLSAPNDWKDEVCSSNVPLVCLVKAGFDSPYDDFYIDRRENYEVDQIIDRLCDKLDLDEYDVTEELIMQAKEEAMEENLGSWTWDW